MTKGELCNPTNSLVHITTGRLPLRTGVIPKGNKVFWMRLTSMMMAPRSRCNELPLQEDEFMQDQFLLILTFLNGKSYLRC